MSSASESDVKTEAEVKDEGTDSVNNPAAGDIKREEKPYLPTPPISLPSSPAISLPSPKSGSSDDIVFYYFPTSYSSQKVV